MSNNPFSAAKDQGNFATRNSKFDIGKVTQVQPHERGDKINHYVKVSINQMDAPQEAPVTVQCHGDVNVPVVDQYVLIGYRKGERPYILDQWYPIEDSIDGKLKSYEAGERILGHPSTDASLLFDSDGNIKFLNSSSMSNGRVQDIREHEGTSLSLKDEDIFVSPDREEGGGVYGVGYTESGVVQSPTESPPTTEYVDLGFKPTRIEFDGQLHQAAYNDPFYSVDDAGAAKRTRAMAECTGIMTLTPLYSDDDLSVNPDDPIASSSKTESRPPEEPYTQEQLQSPTQQVSSKAWFEESGTEYRSYMGDDQVIRLIQGQDASMTERGRVEARIDYVDSTGFQLEWFMNDEPNATWMSDLPMQIQFTATE